MAKSVPINCPECGNSQTEPLRRFKSLKQPIVCRSCKKKMDNEKVKQQLIDMAVELIDEIKAERKDR